jgi:hypothetical protein
MLIPPAPVIKNSNPLSEEALSLVVATQLVAIISGLVLGAVALLAFFL